MSAARTPLPTVLGALTGLLTLVGMLRLVTGAFGGRLAVVAAVVVLVTLLPWVVYAAARARHGRLGGRRLVAVAVLVAVGFALVALSVVGQVLALLCSLAAFELIWVADWPSRRPRGAERYVRIEELQDEGEQDEAAVLDAEGADRSG